MLQQMRANTKTILWIVVVAFGITGFSLFGVNQKSGNKNPNERSEFVGSVNGQKISRQMYSFQYQQLLSQIRARRGDNISFSATESHMLAEQAWETTIMEILRAQEIEKLGITVNDNELVSFLRRNPHPQLQSMIVDDNGNFDYNEYLRQLSNPEMDWTELERWGREQLPRVKFESMLMSQISLPDRVIQEEFEKRTVEMTVQYVKVPWQDEDSPYEPTEQELTARYEESTDGFMDPEKRSIKLIVLEKSATELDDLDVHEQMLEIRKEILEEGDDFAEAAKIHSDDYMTAEKGGNLGFFGRGMMDSLFTETAMLQEIGQISMPVRTEFGYHLIRTEEKKNEDGEEQVRASHILMKVEPGYDTIDSLSTLIGSITDAVRNDGFEKAAEMMELNVVEVEPFIRGAFVKDLGYLPRIVNFAFNYKPGTVSGPIESEDAIYYVKVASEIAERSKPFEEVRDQLVEMVRYDRKTEIPRETARRIKQEAMTSGDLEAVAHSRELEFNTTSPFKINDVIPGIGSNTNFSLASFKLPINRISAPVMGQNEWYVIKVIARTAPDMTAFADQRQAISNEIMQERSYDFLSMWYKQIRADAVVKDDRELTLK
ncbi:MAG: SurA N-terminal domain-containing protein [Candidatus Krumholzibacteria bacterium]|nr:SurA N-terminal domain-containing protein [Candidatus Krumholzibacteria bacterium]